MSNKPTRHGNDQDHDQDRDDHDRQMRRAFGNRGTVASRNSRKGKPIKIAALIAAPVLMVLRPVATRLTDGWWRRKLTAWLSPLGVIIGATNEQVGLLVGTLVTFTMLATEALASRIVHKIGSDGDDGGGGDVEYDDDGVPRARPVSRPQTFWGRSSIILLALATVLQFAACQGPDTGAIKDAASRIGANAGVRISGGEISIFLRYGDLWSDAREGHLDAERYDETDAELLRREQALVHATK